MTLRCDRERRRRVGKGACCNIFLCVGVWVIMQISVRVLFLDEVETINT